MDREIIRSYADSIGKICHIACDGSVWMGTERRLGLFARSTEEAIDAISDIDTIAAAYADSERALAAYERVWLQAFTSQHYGA